MNNRLQIKFFNMYEKFVGIFNSNKDNEQKNQAYLVSVTKTNYHQLNEKFIKYNTVYWEKGKQMFYSIPKGNLLVLLFVSKVEEACLFSTTTRHLFSTIRAFTPQKENYYKNNVGELFDVIIQD